MFAIYLQSLKKEVTAGFYFLHANEHRFLQVDIIVFDGSGQACAKYPD